MISDFPCQAVQIIVLMVLIWWRYQLMAMHVYFGQCLADQATGALFYALNVGNHDARLTGGSALHR